MSTASVMTLERLKQQVDSGTFSISAACSRIDDMVKTLIKDDMTRPFLGTLPKLLTLLLGNEHVVGWIEKAVDDPSICALWSLLKPSGSLFTAALTYSNPDNHAVFEFPASQLPIPLQKHLSNFGPKNLPVPLDICIINVVKEGPPLYVLRLDAGEFYLLRLLDLLQTFNRHNSGSTPMSESRSRSGFGLARSLSVDSLMVRIRGEKAFRFANDHAAEFYHRLIESYLQFFMPVDGIEDRESEESVFSTKSLKSTSGIWTGWRLASFFFTMMTELWLHCHDYQIDAWGAVEGDPPFVLPSVDHCEAVRRATKHLVKAVINPNVPKIPLQLQRFYEQLVEIHLYRLLRLSLANCPPDNTISIIGSIWLEYIAPWKYLPIRDPFSDIWFPYVTNNYLYYHTLLSSFLDYVEMITRSLGEMLDKGSTTLSIDTVRSVLLPLLVLLGKVLSVVGPFVSILREVENEVVSGRSIQFLPSSTLTRHPAQPVSGNIREQLTALESESFKLSLLFDSNSYQRTLRILYWLEWIYNAASDKSRADRKTTKIDDFFKEGNYDIHTVIMQCEEELCTIFEIREENYSSFSAKFEETRKLEKISSTSRIDKTLRIRKFMSLIDPDEKIAQKMHLRAVHPDEKIIKSYENAFLVEAMAQLTNLVNHHYAILMGREELGLVPTFIRELRFNFRFFAAYPNLAFLLLSYLFLLLVLKVVNFVL